MTHFKKSLKNYPDYSRTYTEHCTVYTDTVYNYITLKDDLFWYLPSQTVGGGKATYFKFTVFPVGTNKIFSEISWTETI